MVISLQTADWPLPSVPVVVPLSPGSLKIYTVQTDIHTLHFETTPSGFLSRVLISFRLEARGPRIEPRCGSLSKWVQLDLVW